MAIHIQTSTERAHDLAASAGEDSGSDAAASRISTGSVRSSDGTTIGYRQVGHGPGVVILHGTMSSGRHHLELAHALADRLTVVLPDRRGRGLSGPYGDNDGIDTEVRDLTALLARTGADRVFGVSSGAIIALAAAKELPAIRRVAAFEPPIFADESMTRATLARFEREMGDGNVAAALVTAMKGAQVGPAIFRAMPRRLLEPLTRRFMAREQRQTGSEYLPMSILAPTVRYDLRIVAEMSGHVESFDPIAADVLLLGGGRSPAYLKAALRDLERVLPRAERVEIRGVGHAASWDAEVGGKPEAVAAELRRAFA